MVTEHSLVLIDLVAQVQMMVERSGNPEGFDASAWLGAWLNQANPALAGKYPAEYLGTDEWVQIVRQLLAQMERGTYA